MTARTRAPALQPCFVDSLVARENPYAGFTRSQLLAILLDWSADPPCPDLFVQAWRMTFDPPLEEVAP